MNKLTIPFLLSCLFLASCQQHTGRRDTPVADTTARSIWVNASDVPLPRLTPADLIYKSFYIGSPNHLRENCEFYFECDCCYGELLFNPDFTFYSIDYCMDDQSVAKGAFRLVDDRLILESSGHCVSKSYNWENEVDTSAPDYFLNDTVLPPMTMTFRRQQCQDQLVLVLENTDKENIAIESEDTYENTIRQLEKDGFESRLHHSDTMESLQGPATAKLTAINQIPGEIGGCSCLFSTNKYNYNNRKFIYIDTYYNGLAFISINGQLIRVNLDHPVENDYQVKIEFHYSEQNGDESWWKEGTLTITTPNGVIIKESFVGECGC